MVDYYDQITTAAEREISRAIERSVQNSMVECAGLTDYEPRQETYEKDYGADVDAGCGCGLGYCGACI